MTSFARSCRTSRRGAHTAIIAMVLAASTLLGCSPTPGRPHIHGTVRFDTVPGSTSAIPSRPATIYLPPAAARRASPVLELLHPPARGSSSWLHDSGLQVIATIYAAAHHGIAPIIVLPDLRGSDEHAGACTTPYERDLERFLTSDVPAYVRSHYATAAGRRNWTIAGIAAEGTYAVSLGLGHPDVFGNFADLSGRAGQAGPDRRADWLLQHRRFPAVGGWFESGRDDSAALRMQAHLAELSRAAGVTVHTAAVIGANDWTAWRTSLRQLVTWVMARAVPAAHAAAPSSRLSSGHAPALRRSRSVRRVPQCASGDRGRRADDRRRHPQRAHRSA